jgi:hypothetical protein
MVEAITEGENIHAVKRAHRFRIGRYRGIAMPSVSRVCERTL